MITDERYEAIKRLSFDEYRALDTVERDAFRAEVSRSGVKAPDISGLSDDEYRALPTDLRVACATACIDQYKAELRERASKADQHIFVIDDKVMNGLTKEEVQATAEAMVETGCFRLPYDYGVKVRISFAALCILTTGDNKTRAREDVMVEVPVGRETVLEPYPVVFLCPGRPPEVEKAVPKEIHRTLRDALIVILASKGAIKEDRKLTGLQRLRRQKLEDGVTITDIYLDPRLAMALGGSHASPRMHLRRGHKRDQFYPSTGETRPIFIEPIWVCADADSMVTRTAYTVH